MWSAIAAGLELAREILRRAWAEPKAEAETADPRDVAIAVSSYHRAKASAEAARRPPAAPSGQR
jgi:hypothetical protein